MTNYQDHKYKHGIGWSTWHFEWVTKYRRRVFEDVELQKLCLVFLHEAAKRCRFVIEEIEVDEDHVHIIASLRPSLDPSRAVHYLKGYSSRLLFLAAEPKLRKLYWREKTNRSVWGAGKFMGSVGHITLERAKEYVRSHHAKLTSHTGNPHHLWLGRMSISFSKTYFSLQSVSFSSFQVQQGNFHLT